MATIGLCMIVKNEAKLIRRCLDSCRPLIDYVCISDTGSTDETQKIIANFMIEHNLRGSQPDDRWRDFAHNRNLALDHLRTFAGCDYAFMIDADDQLEIAPGFDIAAFKAGMDKDVYDVMVRHGSVIHGRPQIFRNNYPKTKWVGVLHEYLDVEGPFTRESVNGLVINASIEGSRNADPLKFQKDAEILEKTLETEKNEYLRARYTFYLAQSYRDSKNPEKARRFYAKRASMNAWDQEVYVSLLEAIRACTRLGGEFEFSEAQQYFEQAEAMKIGRAEAHHAMAFLCRQLGKNKEGAIIADRGLGIPMPAGGLFIEPLIYSFGLRDEFAVNAYWAGHYVDCLDSCLQLLTKGAVPPDQIRRVAGNAGAAFEKLRAKFTSNTSFVFSD
jgi:glycosyltransferase involved in cell wall biosynthesis